MTRWDRIRDIFEQALELDESERDPFVRKLCADDAALCKEVLSLLNQDVQRDDYLDTPAATLARSVEHELTPGTRLGPWVVRAVIASGGMGTVYRAERADNSFKKTVAIKLIKAGMNSGEVLARFENERHVLAGLEHPGIAQLLDAGMAENGQPYFVLEYVEGRPIDAHVRDLGLRERIMLLVDVCEAVEVAHKKHVVHRDLKPDNILVTPDGVPKLLDFGIAKVLAPERRATRDGRDTIGPSRVFTPEYASPEQIRGDGVTTASDVYSLGVVLYELLTGERPFDFSGATRAEIERSANGREPALPSTRSLGEQARLLGVTPRALRTRLSGDLDTIVLKALHSSPTRRYTTAAELAEDLRRHMAGRPVLARPDTWSYRVSRLVKRNRALAAASAVVVLVLTIGTVLGLTQHDRTRKANTLADTRFEDLRGLARRFLFELDQTLENSGATTAERERVVRTGLEHLDALSAQQAADASLRRDLVRGYIKIGDLQGGPLVANLGRTDEAMASYRKALSLARELGEQSSEDRGLVAMSLHRVGTLEEFSGSLDAAANYYRLAIELGADALTSAGVGSRALIRALIEVQERRVWYSVRIGDHGGALAHAEELMAMSETTSDVIGEEPRLELLTVATVTLGRVLALVGPAEEAEFALREATESAREWGRAYPRSARADRILGMCLIDLAKFLLGQSRLEECVTLLEESATILRTLAAADPENAQAMRDTCLALNVLAHAYAAVGEHERILEIGLEYRDRALQLVEHDPEIFDHRVDLVGARLAFGRAQSIDGRHKLALDEFLAAQRELEQLVELRPGDSNTLRNLAVVDSEIGMLYTRQAEHAAGPEHRLMLLELAQASFQSGLEVLLGLRDEGRLAPSDDRYVKDARDRIERCSSEIAVLLAGDS